MKESGGTPDPDVVVSLKDFLSIPLADEIQFWIVTAPKIYWRLPDLVSLYTALDYYDYDCTLTL